MHFYFAFTYCILNISSYISVLLINYMHLAKSLWQRDHQNQCVLYEHPIPHLVFSLCCYNHSSGKARFCCGNCGGWFSHKSIRDRQWCWVRRSGVQLAFQFISKVCRTLEFFSTSPLAHDVFMNLDLCTGTLSCWTRLKS